MHRHFQGGGVAAALALLPVAVKAATILTGAEACLLTGCNFAPLTTDLPDWQHRSELRSFDTFGDPRYQRSAANSTVDLRTGAIRVGSLVWDVQANTGALQAEANAQVTGIALKIHNNSASAVEAFHMMAVVDGDITISGEDPNAPADQQPLGMGQFEMQTRLVSGDNAGPTGLSFQGSIYTSRNFTNPNGRVFDQPWYVAPNGTLNLTLSLDALALTVIPFGSNTQPMHDEANFMSTFQLSVIADPDISWSSPDTPTFLSVSTVPEPASVLLLALGMGAAAAKRRIS